MSSNWRGSKFETLNRPWWVRSPWSVAYYLEDIFFICFTRLVRALITSGGNGSPCYPSLNNLVRVSSSLASLFAKEPANKRILASRFSIFSITWLWWYNLSSPSNGRSPNFQVKASTLPFCFPGLKVIVKLNSERCLLHMAFHWFNCLVVMKYSRFLWSDKTSMGFRDSSNSGLYSSNARQMASISLS